MPELQCPDKGVGWALARGPCPIAEALWGGGRQEEHRRERLVLHRGRLEPGDGLSPLSVSFCPSSDTINTEH